MKQFVMFITLCCLIGSASLSHAFPKQGTNSQTPVVSGTILETMDAGGYTYLRVKSEAGEQWVAIPETKVAVGEEVSYYEGMVMKDFSSKTLNKNFDTIIFSSGLAQSGNDAAAGAAKQASAGTDSFAAAVQAEKQEVQGQAMNPHKGMEMEVSGGSAGAITTQQDIKTEKASGENAYTIGEIYAAPEKLNGKTVRVHGKVVKVSRMIMGKNWIHLQDGTGDAMKNSHDLVFTSEADIEEGKNATLEGTLAANKDFGHGYTYVAIVEQATVVPEK